MENTNYDQDSSQTKIQGFNNTLLLVFTPFTEKCLLETLQRKRNGILTTLGICIALLGHQAGKQKQEGRKPALEIHESLFSAFAFLPCSGSCVTQPKQSNLQHFRCVAKYLGVHGPLPGEA